jgi:hypothetical protein
MAWGGDDDRRPEADDEEELDETVSAEMSPRPSNLP